MRLIAKRSPPATVTDTLRAETTNLATPEAARTAFNQLAKRDVRKQLGGEQRHLCAFCMRRIKHDAFDERGEPMMKIAHRIPLAVAPARALTWANLLGSCDGGQRSGGRHKTCDLAQSDESLSVDPTQPLSVSQLHYERRSGRRGLFLTSADPALRRDVEETLRLNDGDLPAARESAWDAFKVRVRDRSPHGYGREAWRRALIDEEAASGDRLREWFGVLEKKAGVF